MAGPNLEVFKFGLYIMFPIAWMYYFGTNLENRFSVPDFWPKPEATYKIPFEKTEIQGELERLRVRRLERRAQRLEDTGDTEGAQKARRDAEQPGQILNTARSLQKDKSSNGGWWNWMSGGNGTRRE